MSLSPDDFEHVDCLDFEDDGSFSISLVRGKDGRLYMEVLHGVTWGDRYMYAPLAVEAGSFDELAEVMGTEAGR